ncbi:MAG: hypothetical protein P8X74_06515 [Reinekea sp.]
MLAKNWGEPMAAPAIFEKQIGIKLLHPASTEGVTDSGHTHFGSAGLRGDVRYGSCSAR